MVRDLTAADLDALDPDELLEEAIRDDRVLRLLEDVVRMARSEVSDQLGTVDGEDVATLDPQASPNRVIKELAWAGFTPNWLLSYEYGGESANLVRFHYAPDRYPEIPFRQLHVRVFDDGTLEAHTEPSALMHKGAHVREQGFDRATGTREVRRLLEDAGVEVHEL